MQKRALVTGAGIRLGRAIALTLSKQGFDVAVHFSGSEDGAESTAEDIRNMGQNAITLQADLLDDRATANLVDRAGEALGGQLSCLVNNASIFEYDTLETATSESWDRHIGSNLKAPFVLTQKFAAQAPDASKDDTGETIAKASIINMLDQRVRKLTPEFMTYTIAKMGLWAMTKTTAQALAPRIRVNAIGPGPTMRGHRQSEGHFARQRNATILERGPNPNDICTAVEYLLAAPAVTGQLICVDGGQHLGWQSPDVLGID